MSPHTVGIINALVYMVQNNVSELSNKTANVVHRREGSAYCTISLERSPHDENKFSGRVSESGSNNSCFTNISISNGKATISHSGHMYGSNSVKETFWLDSRSFEGSINGSDIGDGQFRVSVRNNGRSIEVSATIYHKKHNEYQTREFDSNLMV